ncbi:GNAT family N-acetyltransferase [Roseibium litorale]|uniref:GNAT family N-acetyltransferase n=1 Tax=Roseibium litorale TaxID=2803841 RepID=A0ABR9CIK5_9HYPH|nr:GNAT family N-acetyltransferase [Roseibium litorale]MBD8890661.1 GNAT family N-acetyltransferase [Roseibium litorale]
MPINIKVLKDEDLRTALPDLARLRIEVFKSWPYIYDGSMEYEQRYLQRYAHTDGAVIVGAYDDGQLVGAATGEPLEKEVIQFRRPFEENRLDPKKIFYMAESLLYPAYRGKGIGHQFFDLREAHARDLGYETAAFCAVVRPDVHPLKPADYLPLDPFWAKRGYSKLENGIVYFPWQDVGESEETEKPMQVWIRQL